MLESYRLFISKTFGKSENFITLLELPLTNISERFDVEGLLFRRLLREGD